MGVALKKYIWLLSLLLTIVISYFLAKMTTLFIEGQFPNVVITAAKSKAGQTQVSQDIVKIVDIDAILKRNFFDSKETEIIANADDTVIDDTTEEQQVNLSSEPVQTSLDIKLIATTSVGSGKNPESSCVIRSGKTEDSYSIKSKESFAPSTQIVQILPKKVIFTNKNRLEFVLLEDFVETSGLSTTPTSTMVTKHETREEGGSEEVVQEGDRFQIKRSVVDEALAQIDKLYTDIRAVPYFKDGKANGFKLLSVKRGSFFDKLGLRRGDVLSTVNGTLLDIQSGLQTFNKLKNESTFEVALERRGEQKTFNYEIVE